MLPLDAHCFIALFVGGVLIDLDALCLKEHRKSITHTFIFWGLLSMLLSVFLQLVSLMLFLAAVVHILMDMLDYQVRPFYPILNRWIGLNLVGKRFALKEESLLNYAIANLKTPEILLIELILDILGIIVILISCRQLIKILHTLLLFFC